MAEHIDLDLRRALLASRQLLGGVGREGRSIGDVAGALALLHSTDPVTPYLSIHARSDASAAAIDAALYDDRELVRFTTIRRTVFAMDHDAARAAHRAYNPPLASSLRSKLIGWLETSGEVDEPPAAFLARAEEMVVDTLRGGGPLTGNELASAIPELRVRFDPQPGAAYSKPIRVTSKILELLGAELRIVRTRPTGTDFTSGAWRWTLPDDRLAAVSTDADPAAGLAALLDRYLRSFQPATVTDMTWWTGLTKTKVRAALAALGTVAVDVGGGEEAFARPGDDLEAARPDEASLALLPGLDSTTMGWKQRAWYVDDSPAVGVFDRNGNAGPTIWLGGRVVGVWNQRHDGSIATELLEPLDSSASDRLAGELSRLRSWLGEVRVKWRYPTPITKRLAD